MVIPPEDTGLPHAVMPPTFAGWRRRRDHCPPARATVDIDRGEFRNSKGSRVVSQSFVIATGVTADGRPEVLGFGVGDSEEGAFWTAFLRSLKARGCQGRSWWYPMPRPGSRPRSAR